MVALLILFNEGLIIQKLNYFCRIVKLMKNHHAANES